jgi:hypothetical protein
VFETETVLEGATDTTSSYIQSLVLALVAYPGAQTKAHEEIDRVVGEHRMPTFEDLEQMPYVRAIISEVRWLRYRLIERLLNYNYQHSTQTHRFRPIAPLAVPHASLATEEVR